MYFQIQIFRNTIINWLIPTSIIIAIGIVSFFIDFNNYKKTYEYSGIGLYIYSWMHYIIGFGFIACSIFMLLNYYFADNIPVKGTYEIVDRSSMPGGKNNRTEFKPLIRVDYNGQIKELVFSHEYYEKMNFYKTVELNIRKGLFGFDIIENQKLN
jgi:hypothetical protein